MESESSMQAIGKRKRCRRPWSYEEDEAFLDILIEAVKQGQRLDNGQFKAHTLKMVETKMEQKFPGCGIKVKPHIESAMKRLRIIYVIVYDMLNQSGFGWDDEKKMIKVDRDCVWTEYIKNHPSAKDYRNKPIPLLDKLALAFGKDRATGKGAVAPADVVEELDKEEEQQINDDSISSINQSASKKNSNHMESQQRKRNREANLIANSISELGKNLVQLLEGSEERLLGKVADRLGVVKDMCAASRSIMNALKNMDLTDQERLVAIDKILKSPTECIYFGGLMMLIVWHL